MTMMEPAYLSLIALAIKHLPHLNTPTLPDATLKLMQGLSGV